MLICAKQRYAHAFGEIIKLRLKLDGKLKNLPM